MIARVARKGTIGDHRVVIRKDLILARIARVARTEAIGDHRAPIRADLARKDRRDRTIGQTDRALTGRRDRIGLILAQTDHREQMDRAVMIARAARKETIGDHLALIRADLARKDRKDRTVAQTDRTDKDRTGLIPARTDRRDPTSLIAQSRAARKHSARATKMVHSFLMFRRTRFQSKEK